MIELQYLAWLVVVSFITGAWLFCNGKGDFLDWVMLCIGLSALTACVGAAHFLILSYFN